MQPTETTPGATGHAEASRSGAAERYVLGEMLAAEAEAFEEHFFDCSECAEEVRTGAAFLEGGRALVRETTLAPVVPIGERSRRNWMPSLVAAILVIGLALPLLLQRIKGERPEIDIPQQYTFRSETRAEAGETPFIRNGTVLYVEILGEPSYSRYELRFSDGKGRAFLARVVTPEQAKESIPLVLRGWVADTYELVIVGMDPAGQYAEISRHRFTVN